MTVLLQTTLLLSLLGGFAPNARPGLLAGCDPSLPAARCAVAGTRDLGELDVLLDRLAPPAADPVHRLPRLHDLGPRGPSHALAIGLSVEGAGTLDPRRALPADAVAARRSAE